MPRIYLVAITTIIAWQIALPLIPLHLSAFAADPRIIGVAISGTNVLPLVLAIPAGLLSDLYGSSLIARCSAIAYAVAFALLISAGSLATIVAAISLMGIAQLGLTISTQSLIAAFSSVSHLDRDYGMYAFWVSGGMVVAPIIGGFASDLFGYQGAFLLGLVFAVISIPGALGLRQSPKRADESISPATFSRQPIPRTSRTLLLLLLFSFLLGAAFSIRISFLPIYLSEAGLSTSLIGIVFAVQSLASMAIRPFIPLFVTRFGYVGTLQAGVVAATFATAATPFLVSFVPLAATGGVLGLGLGLTQPITMSLVASSTAAPFRGFVLSLRLASLRLALVVGPVCLGLAVSRFGLAGAFLLAASVLTAGTMLIYLFPLLGSPVILNHGTSWS